MDQLEARRDKQAESEKMMIMKEEMVKVASDTIHRLHLDMKLFEDEKIKLLDTIRDAEMKIDEAKVKV